MGRFERGLAKIPSREPADAASPSPDIAASAPEDLDEYIRRRLHQMLAEHNDKHLGGGYPTVDLDELLTMDGLR